MSSGQRPLVGIGVLCCKGKKVLVGKRQGSHGAGTWALPGGHLELGESFEECGARELLEETGISMPKLEFAYAVNSVFDAQTHYVTVFVKGEVHEGTEAKLLEPHKCEGWYWVTWDQIPEPHFLPLKALLASTYQPFPEQ